MSDESPEFGPRLRAIRSAVGLTQRQLADAAGMHQATIAQYEGGRKPRPALETARRLAAALGVSVDVLTEPADAPITFRPRTVRPE